MFVRFAAVLLAVIGGIRALAGPSPAERPTLVLISLDTTRADALSCYGTVPGLRRDVGSVTPNLDRLAAEGLRFERFYAHAPTTLNSHASMLTGLDPHGHGVPRNGFPVDPSLPTLATRLAEAGYDTIGVVGAKALEAKMGLSRGFRVYDDTTPTLRGLMYQDRAENVVDRALAHVRGREAGKPLFLFVHLYDAHAPYAAPHPWRTRFTDPAYAGDAVGGGQRLAELAQAHAKGASDPADVEQVAALYLGEIAYMDDQIGRLLRELEADGVLDDALVVVTADHGETLSEEPPFAWSHGMDVSDGSMRVPLIWRGYGVPIARSAVVKRQAEMSGLAPTLEVALGLEPTLGEARPFWDLVRPGPVLDEDGWPDAPTRVALMEATRPRPVESTTSWNNLPMRRGVHAGGYTLEGAPAFERPFVLRGVEDEALRRTLYRLLWAWDQDAPPYRAEALEDDTRAALEALGYVDEPGDGVEPVDNLRETDRGTPGAAP